jgi:hypothetical protein
LLLMLPLRPTSLPRSMSQTAIGPCDSTVPAEPMLLDGLAAAFAASPG